MPRSYARSPTGASGDALSRLELPNRVAQATFADMTEESAPLAITGLLETSLYVDDLERAVSFYERVLRLPCMLRNDRICAFDAGRQGALLLFKRGASVADMPNPSGLIPGHDGSGPLHMAFAIASESYSAWRAHLRSEGVKLRGEMQWPAGGRSLYFEDPDGHILELATPGVWPNY
jgi:catechol 2,3-dioxygenase-like lactoylglutathione lyase family enzyme